MKTFAQLRAERIAQIRDSLAQHRAEAGYRPAPAPAHPIPPRGGSGVAPAPRTKTTPTELHTVARSVLLYCLDALQSEQAPPTKRRVAAEMLRAELTSGISQGGR